jgi:hypothetical protein
MLALCIGAINLMAKSRKNWLLAADDSKPCCYPLHGGQEFGVGDLDDLENAGAPAGGMARNPKKDA